MSDQWTCNECGRTHRVVVLTCTHGNAGFRVSIDHRHVYEGYQTTGGARCRICGHRPPELANTTITYTNS